MLPRPARFPSATLALVLLFPACGGGSKTTTGATCDDVAPCGGALVGDWTIQAICETSAVFTGGADCAAATVDGSMRSVSGSLVFNDDATYTVSSSESGSLKFLVPLPCAPAATCDELASLVGPFPPRGMTTCATTDGNCDCTLTFNEPLTLNDNGSYVTVGDALSLTSANNAAPFADRYCVQDKTLNLMFTYPGTTMFGLRISATR
jgi:hypothetical protein